MKLKKMEFKHFLLSVAIYAHRNTAPALGSSSDYALSSLQRLLFPLIPAPQSSKMFVSRYYS